MCLHYFPVYVIENGFFGTNNKNLKAPKTCQSNVRRRHAVLYQMSIYLTMSKYAIMSILGTKAERAKTEIAKNKK